MDYLENLEKMLSVNEWRFYIMSENYFIENKETGKIELHFEKEKYMSLSNDEKSKIKSNFLFSRFSHAWISRCKFPNLYRPIEIAKSLGLENRGVIGERLSFEEQENKRIEKAERRADKYEYKAEKAEKKAQELQAPINNMHGDISFFTQPNINTSAGRAFTNRRNKMFASYERGFEEFRKSEYYQNRAAIARQAKEIPSKGFCKRRIEEAEKTIRAQNRNIESYKKHIEETPTDIDKYNTYIEHANEIIENAIEKVAYYDALIEQQGGIIDRKTLTKGQIVKVEKWGAVRYLKGGPKNFTYEFMQPNMTYADGSPMQGQSSYAEIIEIINN